MAVAFDAASNVAAGTGTLSWTHTPAGVPAGVVVLVAGGSLGVFGAIDDVTGATYGGETMTEVADSPVSNNVSDGGAVHAFFLSSPPAGAQTVTVTKNNNTSCRAVCFTVTSATGETAVDDTAALSQTSGANPSLALSTSASTLAFAVLNSGHDAVTSLAAGAGMSEVLEHDFGSVTGSWIRSTSVHSAGAFSVGWTATSEDAAALAVAIREAPDVTAPQTTIVSGPDDPTVDQDATFDLSASEENCTFEVRLDGGAWGPASGTPASGAGVTTCEHVVTGVSIGEHLFEARAIDASSNVDATPASYSWTFYVPAPIRVRELPLIWLAHDVELPNGRHIRWGHDEPDPAMRASGLEFSDTMPGGHEQASASLPRKPGIDYGDQQGFSTWTIYGPGGEIAWQGRLQRSGRDTDAGLSVAPQGVGWQAALEDNKTVREIYRDVDLGRWADAPAQRVIEAGSTRQFQGPQVEPDPETGEGGLSLGFEGAWTASPVPIGHAWYDGGGIPLGRIFYTYRRGNKTAGVTAASMSFNVWLYTGDTAAAGTEFGTSKTFSSPATGEDTLDATAFRRFGVLEIVYASATAGGTAGSRYEVIFRPVVYGDHGLPIYGTEPDAGLLLSDIVAHALAKWAPVLDFTTGPNGTIVPTTWPIPHLPFHDPTTVAEIVRQGARFELPDWAVWDRRLFHLHPPGHRGRRWLFRVGPTKLREAGHDMARVWNAISVAYRDVDGSTRTVGPPGSTVDVESDLLRDPDPLNPANMAGIPRHDLLDMGKISTPAGAIEVGRRFLELSKALDRSGSAEVVGHAIDDRGVIHPYWAIRSGDYGRWVDASEKGWRKIVKTTKSEASRSCRLDLDAPPDALDAMLQRLDVDLIRLGVS